MLSPFSVALFSAILVMIPDPSTAELDALADKVLEGRNQRPIVSQTIQLPRYMRPGTLLILTEQPIAQDGYCLRTRWLAGIARAGEEDGAPTWWFDRRRGASAEREVALTRDAGTCPDMGYVRLIEASALSPDHAAWALGRADAFLKDAKNFTVRCVADPKLQAECDDISGLRERLGKVLPQRIRSELHRIRISFDSLTTLQVSEAEPEQLVVYLHRPAAF
ncbi:hypothetical protein LCM19_06290 [Qipengyuania flava]|nr:hypothetical protein [Qipengyuania flava]